jgi:hypothetical protein
MVDVSDVKSLKFKMIRKLCLRCQFKSNFFNWCNMCKLKHFKLNYDEFPSGNNEIDKILKNYYCESNSPKELIEWIPYNEFKNITYEGSPKLCSAIWLNGYICNWNKNKFNWNREIKNLEVMLINFENLEDSLYKYKVRFLSKDKLHKYKVSFLF